MILKLESAEGAQLDPLFSGLQQRSSTISRLQRSNQLAGSLPGAVPQAVTFRAFGAI
jgi:hypothetical protein